MPLVIFLLVLAITILGVFSIERGERQRDQAMMGRTALALSSALERRASVNSSYLRAGAALFSMQNGVSVGIFRRFVSEMRFDSDYRGAEGLGWAPVVEPGQAAAFDQQLQALYGTDINLHPAPGSGSRTKIVPVFYLEPETARNRRALGFDMYSESVRRAAIDAAEEGQRPTASGPITLVQEGSATDAGFIVYMPVFSSAGGRTTLKGFIYSPYNAPGFLASATEQVDLNGMGAALYDDNRGKRRLLAEIAGPGKGEARVIQHFSIAYRPMTLVITSSRDGSLSLLSMITLLFGLAVASLLMIVSRLLTQQALEDQRALDWFAEQNSIRNSLTRELNHRVKNTLANVLSIATLTRRRATTLDEYADGLDGRIRALSATHDLLTQSEWGTTPVAAVARAELAPYAQGMDGTLETSGPDVELAPNDALSLGLALHELATNASKYGALSQAGGKVSITWETTEDGLARIDWVESGGPSVPRERSRGFGTDLIEKIVAHELRHPVNLVFAPEGVRCTLLVPVRQPSQFAIRARS
ncbi:histidine kinase [Porphyrobacter algicida]|uniref:histidine kinase n=1 Tax=Qipengyuania algicida TaxID=1836209 RepID=A0A845AIZ7_9SPHN|nr:histidine kinase [Qipengyuania algicida]